MKLVEALQLQHKIPCIVTFVGAGGKTTCMFRLAEELKTRGMRVLVTTTTKIWYPEASQYDRIITHSKTEDALEQMMSVAEGTVTVAAKRIVGTTGKLKGFVPEIVDKLLCSGIADYILVEADGSKNKPIKAPAEHEPVLPEKTDILVGLTGFDCYGKMIGSDSVFRVNEFCKMSGKSTGGTVDAEALLSLITSRFGLFKAAPVNARKVWILNKVDTREALMIAEKATKYIFPQATAIDAVVLSALNQKDPIKMTFYRSNLLPDKHKDIIS